MDTSLPPQFVYTLVQALQCLIYLVGIVAGVILIARKRTVFGILAAVAFLLLGLSLVAGIVIWYVIEPVVSNYGAVSWAALCVTTPLTLLGYAGLVAMAFFLIGKKEKPPSPPEDEQLPKGP